MARKYIKELGDKKSHGVAATEGDRVKTIAPVYYMPSDSSSDSDVKGIQTELDKKEDKTNKTTSVRAASSASDTLYPTEKAVATALADKATKQVRLRFTLSASSTKYVKILTSGSDYRQWICSYNGNAGHMSATWLFRSYATGEDARDKITLISGDGTGRPWYCVAANTWYVTFQNTTSSAYTVVFNVASIDTSELPTLTAVDTLPDGASAITVYGVKYAEQLRTARQLAVSLSNTGTTTTFDGSANVTNIKVSGTLGVGNGGTGKSSVTAGNYLVGNGSSALTEKTPAQVLSDIGAQAALSFDGTYNASTNKVATVSTVTNAIDALDVPASGTGAITGMGAGKTLASLTETNGKVAATFQNISITKSQVSDFSHTHGNITNDGKVGTTADYAVVTTTGGAVTATSLATSSPSTSGNTLEFIDTVSQNSKGKISATKKKVTIDDTYSSTGTNPVSGKAVAAAIETLDVTEVGGDGKYIKKIKEDNGKITATVETMDTTPTASSTKAVTSGGIKTALDGKQNTLATQTAYTSKGTSTKVPQITTNTLGQVTGITEVEISGVAPAPHEHEKLSYTAWANASLPNNTESGVLRRFFCSLPNYNFCVKLFDVTQFYDGTIVDNGNENSTFVGDVSFHRTGGGTLVGKSKVVSGIAYNSTWVRLYGDNKFCHPIILKDSREIVSTWISGSYIPIGDVGSTVSLTPTTNSNLAYCVIDCSTYSSMYINSYSVTGAPTWAFIDSTNKILTRCSGIVANSTVEVPQGAVKLICNIKNTTECKTYCYVAIEAVSPKYYLALQTEGVTMSCYMVCEGRFFTRMTATNTIAARPLLTSNHIVANLGASSPTIIPVGCSIQQNTIYNDVAGTLGTARKLAVSLSNTSTDTTFNGSADVTNIKVTGTLPVSNGGTGKTTVTAAEYNLLSKMGTDLSANAINENYRFVFATTSPSESNGRLAGYRTATAVWSWIKDQLASVSGVNISGNAATASAAQTGSALETAIDSKVSKSGDTMTGKLIMQKAINQVIKGTGVAATSSTSGSTTTYYPAKWNFDLGEANPTAGDRMVIQIPVAGSDYGEYISTDNGTTYYPVARNQGTYRLTTQYPAKAYICVVFEAYESADGCGKVASIYPVDGGTARVTTTNGCWRVINDYDSGNNYERLYTGGRFYAGETGCYPYSLIALDSTGRYSRFISSGSGTGTTKTINTTTKFAYPPNVLYYNANNTAEAGALVSTSASFEAFPGVDLRYSCNYVAANFATFKPVFIECTMNDDGTWTPTSNSITQTLTAGNFYVYLGESSGYSLYLQAVNMMYYYDGTQLVSVDSTLLSTKANDEDVVHKAGEEVITGRKVFQESVALSQYDSGETGYNIKCLGDLSVTNDSYTNWPSEAKDGHHYREWEIVVPYNPTFGEIRVTLTSLCGVLQRTIRVDTCISAVGLMGTIANPDSLGGNNGYYTIADNDIASDFRISDLLWDSSLTETYKFVIKIRSMHPERNLSIGSVMLEVIGDATHFEDAYIVSNDPQRVTGETYEVYRYGDLGTSPGSGDIIETVSWLEIPKIQNCLGKDILVDGDIVQSSANGNLSVLGTDVEVYSHPTQTAYTSKGTATKVPQITTDSTGHVTSISEVTISGVTPASHASTATTYGIGTTSNYGHVKLATGDMNGATNTDGVAVSKNHTHSQYAPKASPALTGTPTAPTAADGTNTTQIATTAFVQSAVTQGLSVSDAMVYKGTITIGATSPGGLTVAADKGHTYKVVANGNTKEGYVDGIKVEAGDMVICNTDSTAAATSSNYSTIAAKWDFVQGNTDGVVVGPASATSGNVVVFDGATGKLVKDGGKLGTAAFKDVASSGNASTTQVVMGNDSRLTDSRTPTSHTHGNITNGGALQTSDVTIASGDKLVITDASDSNKVARASVAFDGSTVSTMLTKKGTFETVKEGNLEWGGRVWTGSYGPLDAALIDVLGANRFAFGNGNGVTVEYTRDGGTTWSDYGLTKAQKSSIFTLGQGFIIGKADSTNKATADANWSNYKVRVTMQTGTFGVYTYLQKLAIYCSTNGSQGTRVVITARTRTNEQSDGAWTNIITASLSGWSGWNIIPVSLTTWGNAGSQYSQIRFLFEATQASSEANKQYTGFSISRIYGYGGVGWTVPSTMAASGRMYTYDIDKNVTFPAKVTATEFVGPLSGNAATATKATQDSDGNVISTTYLKELYQAEYGVSTFADIYAAVTAKKTVYCKVPGGDASNGARMAFLAYINVSNPPTSSSNIEFQYYRSNSSGTGDSVFVYTITNNNNTWTTVERAASSSVKGNAESTYRTGQVNLTPANLGISATTSSVTVGSTTFNKYTHPTTSGNKHVPSGGSSGQFLGWDSDGTAKWVSITYMTVAQENALISELGDL